MILHIAQQWKYRIVCVIIFGILHRLYDIAQNAALESLIMSHGCGTRCFLRFPQRWSAEGGGVAQTEPELAQCDSPLFVRVICSKWRLTVVANSPVPVGSVAGLAVWRREAGWVTGGAVALRTVRGPGAARRRRLGRPHLRHSGDRPRPPPPAETTPHTYTYRQLISRPSPSSSLCGYRSKHQCTAIRL